jgi:hypothetical protein
VGRTFAPVTILAFALYVVQGGTATVTAPASFTSSFLAANATQAPFAFLSTSSFAMQFSYAAAAVLRAVTQTQLATGSATSISLLGSEYTNDIARLWIIQAPVPGFLIELFFTTISTQPNADFVTVYNGMSGTLAPLLRVAGSPSLLPNLTSTSERITMLFTSDGSVSHAQGLQGFAADFHFIRRVNQTGNIGCTGACYAANVQYKW